MRQVPLKTLLELSIEEERRSQELYRRAAELVRDDTARRFLEALLAEEARHEQELREVTESVDLDRLEVPLEGPAFEESARAHGPEDETIAEGESARGLLLLALKREKRASLLYARMAESAHEPSLRALLERLAASEDEHASRIRERFQLGA